MFVLPPWVEYPFAALIFGGPVLLAIAAVLLAVPRFRRVRPVRRAASWLLAACGALVVTAAVSEGALVVATMPNTPTTRHLQAPEVVGGILFPAGSTVRVWPVDGSLDSGTVPSATIIDGLPLIGEFFPMASNADHRLFGTLASATTVIGVPCAPGPVQFQGDTVRCVLARDYTFEGHVLAGGQLIDMWSGTGPLSPDSVEAPPKLRLGVLAREETLFGTVWPAGTIVGGITVPPEEMVVPDEDTEFCLPAGKAADIGVATLHGPIAYTVEYRSLRVFTKCALLADTDPHMDGYAQVGPDLFHIGTRSRDASAWTWSPNSGW